MRMNFNILWVDDLADQVEPLKEAIENMLRKQGFRLNVALAANLDEAMKYVSDDVYNDNIDLILMDYNLGKLPDGGDVMVEVRRRCQYKDIIFYSATSTKDLSTVVAGKKIQGVFTANRTNFKYVVDGVIESIIRRTIDIDHSRGIVMGATSDIDMMIFEYLQKKFGSFSEERKNNAMKKIIGAIRRKEVERSSAIDMMSGVSDVGKLEGYHEIFTSYCKFRALRREMTADGELGELKEKFDKYQRDVPLFRNILAHCHMREEGFSQRLYDKDGNEITSEHMREFRVFLLEFQNLIRARLEDVG